MIFVLLFQCGVHLLEPAFSHKEGGSIQIQCSMSQSSRWEGGSIHSSNDVHPLSHGSDDNNAQHPAHRELGEPVAPNMECEETAMTSVPVSRCGSNMKVNGSVEFDLSSSSRRT